MLSGSILPSYWEKDRRMGARAAPVGLPSSSTISNIGVKKYPNWTQSALSLNDQVLRSILFTRHGRLIPRGKHVWGHHEIRWRPAILDLHVLSLLYVEPSRAALSVVWLTRERSKTASLCHTKNRLLERKGRLKAADSGTKDGWRDRRLRENL